MDGNRTSGVAHLARSLLTRFPVLRKALCATRIALGIKRTGAYTVLGRFQAENRDYFAAARTYLKAIRSNPTGSDDAYFGLLEVATACPEILYTPWDDNPAAHDPGKISPQQDWFDLSFGLCPNVPEFCAALDYAIKRDPHNLNTYHRANALNALGEFKAGLPYFRRLTSAQQSLALARGFQHSTVRYLRDFWVYNIGHILFMDWYLKAGLLGWRPPQKTIVLAPEKSIANKPYLELFRPYLDDIITDAHRIEELKREAECFEVHPYTTTINNREVCSNQAIIHIQQAWEAQDRPPLLTLPAEEMERGKVRLRQLGIPDGAWYVGVHVRESGFHGDHNQKHRNASITFCEMAIQSIAERGGWVIRMGNPTMTKLKPMPQVVDYAHHDLRCDWMDVFLCATMRFMIGTPSGLTHVPFTFGVPTISTNWTTIFMPPWNGKDLFLPKLLFSESENRFLSLKEMFSSGAAFVQTDRFFAEKRVRFVENSPEDINDIVLEMLDRLAGRPPSSESDAIHDRARQITQPYGVTWLSRMGCAFSKKHSFLLNAN